MKIKIILTLLMGWIFTACSTGVLQGRSPQTLLQTAVTLPPVAPSPPPDHPEQNRRPASQTRMRYNFIWFKALTHNETLTFGGREFVANNPSLPRWMVDQPYSNFVNQVRPFGYLAESMNGGETWMLREDLIPPLKISGSSNLNGVLHFVTDFEANWFSQGFVSYVDWDRLQSRIYPVFFSHGKWSYQDLGPDQTEPLPVLGSPDPENHTNIYSPAIVPNGDSEKSIKLYFGGWRGRVEPQPETCEVVDHSKVAQPFGYRKEVCNCGYGAIDACTGDKIFVATNAQAITGTSNKLLYKVYQNNGQWSPDGRQEQYFRPIISAARYNNECADSNPQRCPLYLVHTNDPTVVKTPHNGYVMYFTGAAIAKPGGFAFDYTHVATSWDGLQWENFAILRHGLTASFPGGLEYNAANGSVRATYDAARDRIVLMSVANGYDPHFINVKNKNISHPDANSTFIYEVDPKQPEVVVASRRIPYPTYLWSLCRVDQFCAQAQNMSCRFRKFPVSKVWALEELPGWGAQYLAGGAGYYSSHGFTGPIMDRPQLVAAWMDKGHNISAIRLNGRMYKNAPQAFPKAYQVWITNEDNTSWVSLGRFDLQPSQDGIVSLELGSVFTHGVAIGPHEVSPDSLGNHYFQMGEIQFISTAQGCE